MIVPRRHITVHNTSGEKVRDVPIFNHEHVNWTKDAYPMLRDKPGWQALLWCDNMPQFSFILEHLKP